MRRRPPRRYLPPPQLVLSFVRLAVQVPTVCILPSVVVVDVLGHVCTMSQYLTTCLCSQMSNRRAVSYVSFVAWCKHDLLDVQLWALHFKVEKYKSPLSTPHQFFSPDHVLYGTLFKHQACFVITVLSAHCQVSLSFTLYRVVSTQ